MKILTPPNKLIKQLLGMGMLFLLFVLVGIKASAQANFTLFPATTTVAPNQTFTLEVRVDLNQSTNTELDVAEAYLNFNPTYLQVVSIANGGTLNSVALSASSNSTGRVDYSAGTLTPPVTTDFTLLIITFRAIALPPTGSTTITFNTALPRQTNAFRLGSSVLGTTTGATVIISVPTPVTFISFSATSQRNNIILKWTTATEINNRGFEIQRKQEGTDWTVIEFVNGAGDSNEEKKYSHTDLNLNPGVYQYRLKQIDHDGNFEYSHIVLINLGGERVFELEQNRPNPASGRTSISFSLAEKRKVTLTLFDTQGRLVKKLLDETRESGTHVIDVNSQMLTSGIYYYKMTAGDLSLHS